MKGDYMDKIINKLQELIEQELSLPEQRKKEFLDILDDFRGIDSKDLRLILGSVLERANKNTGYLVKFLEEVLAVKLAYIHGGADGVRDIIAEKQKTLEHLKNFSQ